MDERHDYDVVVIGAGPGGLAAAAYLGMTGRRVLVVDARGQVGGHMSAFTHAGCEFDIGLHYTVPGPVQQVLRPLGVEVEFREFDPDGMFVLTGAGPDIAVPKGVEAFRARLHQAFPGEEQAIDTFLGTVAMLAGELEQIPDRPHLRELPAIPWRLRGLLRYGTATLGGYLASLHASPWLQTALTAWTSGSMAVSPARMSLPAAAFVIRHYLDGLAYPQGGSRVISEGLAEVVRRHGGEVLTGTEVTRILVTGGRVRGVRMGDASLDAAPGQDRDVLAPAVVSAVGIQQTYLRLLAPDVVPGRVLRRVRSYEMALPLAVAYLVLGRDLAAEGYRNATRLAVGAADISGMYAAVQAGELPEDGMAGAWIANLADPGNPRLCRPGQTSVQLISVAPAQHAWWGIAPGSGPTARYAARKREVRDWLVRLGERAIPGLSESIVYEETATPVTDERFMRSAGGTSYGPALTPRQAFTRMGPPGAVPGLFHAGASVRPSHGLVGTLHGGLAAAAAVSSIPVAELLTRSTVAEAVSVR